MTDEDQQLATPDEELEAEAGEDMAEELTMTFTREQWQRIYMSVRERRDGIDKEAQTVTWLAHEQIRLDILEKL